MKDVIIKKSTLSFFCLTEQIQEETYENMKSTESTPEQQSTQELPENNAPQKPQQQIYETI